MHAAALSLGLDVVESPGQGCRRAAALNRNAVLFLFCGVRNQNSTVLSCEVNNNAEVVALSASYPVAGVGGPLAAVEIDIPMVVLSSSKEKQKRTEYRV